jgi:hypothetical protein
VIADEGSPFLQRQGIQITWMIGISNSLKALEDLGKLVNYFKTRKSTQFKELLEPTFNDLEKVHRNHLDTCRAVIALLSLAQKAVFLPRSDEIKHMKKIYKTKLYRMKVETFIKRLLSGKYGNRLRQWLNGQLTATVVDGWIELSRI